MDKSVVDQFLSAVPLRCFQWPVVRSCEYNSCIAVNCVNLQGFSYSIKEQQELMHAVSITHWYTQQNYASISLFTREVWQ